MKKVREYIDDNFKETFDVSFRDWLLNNLVKDLTNNYYLDKPEYVMEAWMLYEIYKDQ